MPKQFHQLTWTPTLEEDLRQLVRLAVREDLAGQQDWTTVGLVSRGEQGRAEVVAREEGIVCGVHVAQTLFDEMGADCQFRANVNDGDLVSLGDAIACIDGAARDILIGERPLLNFMGRLSGIATLTQRFVNEVEGTGARIYDTRKTTPGWRLLEKYAVGCGGGMNHRRGLYDAILIKDNHLALAGIRGQDIADAVSQARRFLIDELGENAGRQMIVEVEVDSLEQLSNVLPANPDIVLLDNMSFEELKQAVANRDENAPEVELEASGGVNLASVRKIAETGVDRISAGALTHSARTLDIGLDWK